jgi:hypothetical protein
MLLKQLRFLRTVATLPALALLAIGATHAQTSELISPRQHGPMQFHGFRTDGTTESTNWSGYAVTGTSFTQAVGSWTVPSVNCSVTPSTYAAFWVGIDGYSSSTVEQTGTDSDCSGKNPSYYAWYEFYPNPSIEISSLTIKPGDNMSAEVSYSGSEFTIKITDTTTGKSYTKSSKVSGAQRTSAEWIAEAPCCTNRGGILPLSDFGTVSLGLDYTGVSGSNYAIDSSSSNPIAIGGFSTWEEITMVTSSGVDEAVPTSLTADGTSFQVTWKSK